MNLNNTRLPGWLESNRLFRGLFLFRKLFLTRLVRLHYAQFGEDIVLERLFPGRAAGFFVDVGCFHPIQHSNTWRLYRRGWRGINIDVDEIKIRGFTWVRPGDVNLVRAISDHEGEVECYSRGIYSLESSLDGARAGRGEFTRKTVPCSTLTAVLDATAYKDRPIDLLSIDTEGHDLQVLESLDFARYQPRVVAVESFARTLPAVEETAVYRLLRSRGYVLVAWCGLTLLMGSSEFVASRTSSKSAAS